MVDPRPLRDENGVPRLFICGYCGKAHSTGEFASIQTYEQKVILANESRQHAETCCQCMTCLGLAGVNRGRCNRCTDTGAMVYRWTRLMEERSLRNALDVDAARDLLEQMETISQDKHLAGWLVDLETVLWNNPDEPQLMPLAARAGGWWVAYEYGVRLFLTTKQWDTRRSRGHKGSIHFETNGPKRKRLKGRVLQRIKEASE